GRRRCCRTGRAPPARSVGYGLVRRRCRGCPFVVPWSAMGDMGNGTAAPGGVSQEDLRRAAEVLAGAAVGKARRNKRNLKSAALKRDIVACLLALGVMEETPRWFEDADTAYAAFHRLGSAHQFARSGNDR